MVVGSAALNALTKIKKKLKEIPYEKLEQRNEIPILKDEAFGMDTSNLTTFICDVLQQQPQE